MTPPPTAATGVLLMTFGSATTAEGVPEYLASVRGGRDPDPGLVAEFQRRYARVGGSPLIDITRRQAELLEQRLAGQPRGPFLVEAGMLHSHPRIPAAVDRLVERGAARVIAIVLAPQYSPLVLSGYERAIAALRQEHPSLDIDVAGAWHRLPEWVDSLAERLDESLAELPPAERERIRIIFTAHSLPRPVVERDPGYVEQLRETARAVAQRTSLADDRWLFAFQSAGHTPEEWLKPDVKDLLPGLAAGGVTSVLVVPVQFLADHLEILYDIDVAAVEEAAELGVRLHRISMPNTSPTFINALAAVVERELGRVDALT